GARVGSTSCWKLPDALARPPLCVTRTTRLAAAARLILFADASQGWTNGHTASREGVSRLLGPVSPRRAGAGLAARGRRAVPGDGMHHARRAGAGGDRGARTRYSGDRNRVRHEL